MTIFSLMPPSQSHPLLFPFHKKTETCSQVLQLSSPICLEADTGSWTRLEWRALGWCNNNNNNNNNETKKQQKTEISSCSIEEECKAFMINLSSFQQMLDRWKALEAKLLNPMTEGRAAKSELLLLLLWLLLFLLCSGGWALPNMCWTTPAVRECFSATIRGRAECPPSPVVFFPSSLFSHPI